MENIFADELPSVVVPYRHRNPEFRPGDNPDTYYMAPQMVRVDVLTVHFNRDTMRVRYTDPSTGKPATFDCDAAPFFAKYALPTRPAGEA